VGEVDFLVEENPGGISGEDEIVGMQGGRSLHAVHGGWIENLGIREDDGERYVFSFLGKRRAIFVSSGNFDQFVVFNIGYLLYFVLEFFKILKYEF
jgi:hypothetical protein